MAVDERSRHALQGRLEQVLGFEHAEILMSHLREVGSGDLVTRTYLDERLEVFEERILRTVREDMHTEIGGLRADMHREIGGLRSETQAEIGGLRAEMQAEIGGLRSDMGEAMSALRSEISGEISGVRSDVHDDVRGLSGEFRGLYGEFNKQTRILLFSLFGANATFAGLVFAAVRFA